MHVGQQGTAVLKRSLLKFNRNKQTRRVRGNSASTPGTWQGQTPARPRALETQPSHHLSGTPPQHFCIPSAADLLAWLPPPLTPNWKQTTLLSKELWNYFLPEQSHNIKHALKSCTIPLEKFYDLVAAAGAAPWPGQLWVRTKQWGHTIISFPFKGRQTVQVSIFRLCSSGAINRQKLKPQGQHCTSRAK